MKIVAIHSGTGGVGKSFIAANLAASIFKLGNQVALFELCKMNILPIHFGENLLSDKPSPSSRVADSDSTVAKRHIHSIHDEYHFKKHSLHADFSLMTTSGECFDENLMSALRFADRMVAHDGIIVLDLPTNIQPVQSELVFDIELEVIAAEPVSMAVASRRYHNRKDSEFYSDSAHEHFVVINKKDLRSSLSVGAATLIEENFSDSVIGAIHHDTIIPDAFAHRSLISNHSPNCQVAMEINEIALRLVDRLQIGDIKNKDLA